MFDTKYLMKTRSECTGLHQEHEYEKNVEEKRDGVRGLKYSEVALAQRRDARGKNPQGREGEGAVTEAGK